MAIDIVDDTTPAKKAADKVIATSVDNLVVRKREVFNYVTENTSLKKKEAREAVEAMLAYLHTALTEEKEVNLPPLGKIMSKRVKIGTPAEKVVYKLNLRKADPAGEKESKEALAEVGE